MIHLEENGLKQLSVKTLFELLGLDVDASVEQQYPANYTQNLYQLARELLETESRCIILDWRWGCDELVTKVQSIKQLTSDIQWHVHYDLPPDEGEEIQPDVQSIAYKLPDWNYWQAIDFDLDDTPDELFEELNKHLRSNQFISINLGDDSYCYLIVPKDIDIDKFCAAVGLQIQESIPKARQKAEHISLVDVDNIQQDKLFFTLGNDKGPGYVFERFNWHGRVLPGQTIREGIAKELSEMEHSNGSFSIKNIGFRDFEIDKLGNRIPRYWITIAQMTK